MYFVRRTISRRLYRQVIHCLWFGVGNSLSGASLVKNNIHRIGGQCDGECFAFARDVHLLERIAGRIEQGRFADDGIFDGKRHVRIGDLPGHLAGIYDLVTVKRLLAIITFEIPRFGLPSGGANIGPDL